MQIEVTIQEKQHNLKVPENISILEALLRKNIHVLAAPCGGRGTCGKCRVYVEGMGDVLACQTNVQPGMKITIRQEQLQEKKAKIAEDGQCVHYPPDGTDTLDAACDIGTTTVVCHLLDGKTGEKLATVSAPSAQRGFGADVLSRIQAADAGHLKLLQTQITKQVAQMLQTMKEQTGRTEEIARLAVAGNTVMSHLFAGISPSSIGVTPFLPEEYFGKEYTGEELGLSDCRKVYIAPAAAGFVGGDITADLLCVFPQEEAVPDQKLLLLDVGTNGEMAVGTTEEIYCCATAVGSAFEGAQMAMGMPASEGAISHVWLDQRRIRVEVIGEKKACGICGSGIIDALAVLLSMGVLLPSGCLKEPGEVSVAYRRYLGVYKGLACVWLTPEVCITQEDIHELQLAKAAFAAGLQILLQESGTSYEQLQQVILAGGFGSYLDKGSAAAIGLIPQELLSITQSVGNAAGEGAVSAALSQKARQKLLRIKEKMHYIELSTHPEFPERYMEQMSF